jgi:hypothetical protein
MRYGDLADDANWQAFTHDVADILTYKLGKWQTDYTADHLQRNVSERSLKAVITHIYGGEATANQAEHVFIKENRAYKFAAYLLASFPDAKFVLLTRDPRDMALSWKRSPNHPDGVKRAANQWKADQGQNLTLYAHLKESDRIILTQYEDLVSNPERELKHLCSFLNLAYTDEMLDYHNNQLTIDNAQRLQNWRNLQEPILKSNFDKYKQALSPLEIQYIEALCETEMGYLGIEAEYELTDDLESLERQLDEYESTLSFEGATLTPEEMTIRQNRLDVIKRIINRRLWANR